MKTERFYGLTSSSPRHPAFTPAFSLVELLVVVAIIGILVSLILPGLSNAKERSRRVVCASTVRQFVLAVQFYAADNRDVLLKAGTDATDPYDTHTPVLSRRSLTNLLKYLPERLIDCPSLHDTFESKKSWRIYDGWGVAIGYHYLGGQANTPWNPPQRTTNRWISPQKTSDDPNLPLLADLNVYSYSYGRILAPHTAQSAVLKDGKYFGTHPDAIKQTPRDIGAEGGNVGVLAGSVNWKPVRAMANYRTSQLWGDDGSFGLW